ncbi:hypothetical protein, partial [Brumimicrobium mesophilum]|uniref:hypothetical protein n=1 Tax=Brumimicrobium mesophilum TaxID=392717 RepID=UPI001F23F6B6
TSEIRLTLFLIEVQMKHYLNKLIFLFIGSLMISFNLSDDNEELWERYNLEQMALTVEVPKNLTPICGEGFCFFRTSKGSLFEVIDVKRYYIDSLSENELIIKENDNKFQYYEIESNNILIKGKTKVQENESQIIHSWAQFSTEEYMFKFEYKGQISNTFKRFLQSIIVNHDLLNEQYRNRSAFQNFNEVATNIEISTIDRDYLINRKNNIIKIKTPKIDTFYLYPSCNSCMLKRIDIANSTSEDWSIYPATTSDSIKIDIMLALPENNHLSIHEKWFKIKDE